MKNLAKLCVIGIFALFSFAWLISGVASSSVYRAHAQAKPTPPANSNAAPVNTNTANTAATNTNTAAANTAATNTNTAANTNMAVAPANTASTPAGGDKSIPDTFTLGQGSQSDEGEVAFNHKSHATGLYSPDGKSTIGCVECHHTDQPKKPPLTSERDVPLTMETWKTNPKVSTCRSCHFQNGFETEGKDSPFLGTLKLNNREAYHKNCNECHDAAVKARKGLKDKPGFATSIDCKICHKPNN